MASPRLFVSASVFVKRIIPLIPVTVPALNVALKLMSYSSYSNGIDSTSAPCVTVRGLPEKEERLSGYVVLWHRNFEPDTYI